MRDAPSSRFPRCARLRAAAEFQAVFGEGKRFSGAYFRLQVRLTEPAGGENGQAQARLGTTVSKRVDKAAVGRNRIRRQIKECFRLRQGLPAGDYVMLAKPEAARASNAALRADLNALFERARALKPGRSPGTMPASDAT